MHVYKTGGTSISQALAPYGDNPLWLIGILRAARRTGLFGDCSPKIKFGKLRRFAKHATADEIRASIGAAKYDASYSFGFVRNPWSYLVSCYHYQRQTVPDFPKISFEAFVDTLPLDDAEELRQSRFLFSPDGSQRVSFIGRFENMAEDLLHVGGKIGVSFSEIEHLNRSRHAPYREYYSQHTADRVGQLFAQDIDRFGYKF